MNYSFPHLSDLLSRLRSDATAIASLQRTLVSLNSQPPQAVIHALTARVLPKIATHGKLQLRFKLLEEARKTAERVLPALEENIAGSGLPLAEPVAHTALMLDNLMKAMTRCYGEIAQSIVAQHQAPALGHLLRSSALHAMRMISRRHFLASQVYAEPSPCSWQSLHELYRLTCTPGTRAANAESAVIEREYLSALLFAYFEPNHSARGDLGAIRHCARQLASHATIRNATPNAVTKESHEISYFVAAHAHSAGHRLTRLPPGTTLEGGLIIDCSQVLAALDRNLARRPDAAPQPDLAASALLLQSLRSVLGGKRTRRFKRTRFKPRADLVGGLDEVIAFLDGNIFSRRSLDAISRNDTGAFSTSEWALIDESPDGFLVRFIKGEKWKLGVGAVVALQPRESGVPRVCLVRRVASTAGRLDIGLQLLSPQVSVIRLTDGRKPPRAALFLHTLPAYGKFPGLIAAPGKLAPGQRISFHTQGRILQRKIGKCIEANEGLEFLALDPLQD